MIKLKLTKGFTLPEILITVAILTLVIGAIGAFQANIFSINRVIQAGINSQYEVKKILRPFTNEVRGATSSDNGSYALAEVGTTTFIFYSNVDADSKIERVRYFLDGQIFKKGITKSSGEPASYNQDNEQIVQVVHDVVAGNIFEYYDSNYDGTASSSALSFPVNPSEVRLVKINIQIDSDPNKEPSPIFVETQVSIRNLKDNR
jgi:prepilin-type N-terminal cleavage/methylation domain-containing protein